MVSLSEGEIDQLIIEAKSQARKTNACKRHFFGEFNSTFGAKYKCSRCGCIWRLHEVGKYIRGYEAAGKNGGDILIGWNGEENVG